MSRSSRQLVTFGSIPREHLRRAPPTTCSEPSTAGPFQARQPVAELLRLRVPPSNSDRYSVAGVGLDPARDGAAVEALAAADPHRGRRVAPRRLEFMRRSLGLMLRQVSDFFGAHERGGEHVEEGRACCRGCSSWLGESWGADAGDLDAALPVDGVQASSAASPRRRVLIWSGWTMKSRSRVRVPSLAGKMALVRWVVVQLSWSRRLGDALGLGRVVESPDDEGVEVADHSCGHRAVRRAAEKSARVWAARVTRTRRRAPARGAGARGRSRWHRTRLSRRTCWESAGSGGVGRWR